MRLSKDTTIPSNLPPEMDDLLPFSIHRIFFSSPFTFTFFDIRTENACQTPNEWLPACVH